MQGHPMGQVSDRRRTSIEARFWSKIHVGNSPAACWKWTGTHLRDGYCLFDVGSDVFMAHRFAYELLAGPIPEGLHIDHLCRERDCVNPLHLEPVTPTENARRAYSPNAAKTHCAQGHAFDEENTYFDSRGWRGCRACRRAAERKHKRSKGR